MGLFDEIKSKAKNYSPKTLSDEPVKVIDKNYQPDFSDIEKNREEARRREKESKHQKSQETTLGRKMESLKEHSVKKPKSKAPVVKKNPMATYTVWEDELVNADEDFGHSNATESTDDTESEIVVAEESTAVDSDSTTGDEPETAGEGVETDGVDITETSDDSVAEEEPDAVDNDDDLGFDDTEFFGGDNEGETVVSFPQDTTGNGYDKASVDEFVQSVATSVSRTISGRDISERNDESTTLDTPRDDMVEKEKYDELLERYEKLHSFVTEQISEVDMKRYGLNYKPNSIRDALAQHKRSRPRRAQG